MIAFGRVRLSSGLRPSFFWKKPATRARAATTATATRSASTLSARDQTFFEKGWLDEHGLTRFDTLHELQTRSCAVFKDNPLYGVYNEQRQTFEFGTYGDFGQQVGKAREVLHHLGVTPLDKIALIANNRWEWAALSTAAYALNASVVPMYEAQLPSDWSYIVQDAEPKVLFCATQEIYDRVQKDVKPNAPSSLQSILCLDAASGEPHAFSTLMDAVTTKDASNIIPPTPEDLASLIYTSGTTGKPKGVELTHGNITSNVKGVRNMVDRPKDFFSESDRALAFLPWAHSFGQTIDLWTPMAHGTSSAISRGFQHVQDDLQLVQPTALASVPILFKKVFDGVNNVMETANPRRKYLMQKALQLGRKNSDYTNGHGPSLGFVERMQFAALDKLVLSKIRDRLGGKLRCKCCCCILFVL